MGKTFAMKARGEVGSQRAPGIDSKELNYGPFYDRTLSMKALSFERPKDDPSFLTMREEVQKGSLTFSLYEEEGCIRPLKAFGPLFKVMLLEKVSLEDITSTPDDEFYPILRRLLVEGINWGSEFTFRGLSAFVEYLMEWTEHIMDKFKPQLKDADIYGLVGISQYPYHYHVDVWRAFCEHWSPLTNTLHHGGGEVGISLFDLKEIGGLPILGNPYEEYLPPNEHLLDETKYPSTVVELLRIHAELCQLDNTSEVSWYRWIHHFFRGKQERFSYAEKHQSSSLPRKRKPQPLPSSNERSKKMLPLDVSVEGELAAFIVLLLSRFVLPHGHKSTVRTTTFVMASLLAQGKKVSLAPTVLGHIYHGLGEMATYQGNPGGAKPNFGIHFVVGWLAVYFRDLYESRPNEEFDEEFPRLAEYSGVPGRATDLYNSRLLIRGTGHVFYRAGSFGSNIENINYVESGQLSDQCFEHLLTIRSVVLPVRLGSTLILEPYYPNRFARQFGFDQGVPANALSFAFSERSKASLEDIARAYGKLFRRDTGDSFHILPSHHEGVCTLAFCNWWSRISAPYLAQSCHKVKTIITCRKSIERGPVCGIGNTRIINANLRGPVRIAEQPDQSSEPALSIESSRCFGGSSNKTQETDFVEESSDGESLSADVNFKRRRHGNRSKRPVSPQSLSFNDSPIHNNASVTGNTTFPREHTPSLEENTVVMPTEVPHVQGDVISTELPQVQPSISEQIFSGVTTADPSHCSDESFSKDAVDYDSDEEFTFDDDDTTLPHTPSSCLKVDQKEATSIIVWSETPSSKPRSAPLDIAPLESIPHSLRKIFPESTKTFLRAAVVESIKALASTIANSQLSQSFLSVRAEILDDLEALKFTAKAAKVADTHLSWIFLQAGKSLKGIDILTKLAETTDTTSLHAVSTNLSVCNAELASYETELSQLHKQSLIMKEREEEILRQKEPL